MGYGGNMIPIGETSLDRSFEVLRTGADGVTDLNQFCPDYQ